MRIQLETPGQGLLQNDYAVSSLTSSTTIDNTASVPAKMSTDEKIVLMREKLVALIEEFENRTTTIQTLVSELISRNIEPNIGAVPHRLGMIKSNEEGELGKLENKAFALQKKICHQGAVIDYLRSKLI